MLLFSSLLFGFYTGLQMSKQQIYYFCFYCLCVFTVFLLSICSSVARFLKPQLFFLTCKWGHLFRESIVLIWVDDAIYTSGTRYMNTQCSGIQKLASEKCCVRILTNGFQRQVNVFHMLSYESDNYRGKAMQDRTCLTNGLRFFDACMDSFFPNRLLFVSIVLWSML